MTASDYQRIAAAIEYLRGHAGRQPRLDEVAHAVHLSPHHLQRVFRRWAGISPKRFLQHLTVTHAKRLLADSHSVLDASLAVGLSGPGRLHDHFVELEAVTPGEQRRLGEGLTIHWGRHDSPFGPMFLAETSRGICRLAFSEESLARVDELARSWPRARIVHSQRATAGTAQRLWQSAARHSVLIRGTNFQVQVWRALLALPPGVVTSYGRLAAELGRGGASRAVGRAVGDNPVAWLIPCHRVLRSDGELGGYRWGTTRKQAMLAWERARTDQDTSRLRPTGSRGC